jgi:DNA polymerase III delta subunit
MSEPKGRSKANLDSLIEQGKEKGLLTYDDINQAIGDEAPVSPDQMRASASSPGSPASTIP